MNQFGIRFFKAVSNSYKKIILHTLNRICTGREARTPDTWFWRPVLYQLSYARIFLVNKFTSKQVNKITLVYLPLVILFTIVFTTTIKL